jgi:hypothetical protein
MTGLYFAEVCLIGLFFITPSARAQGIVMVVVLVITALYHIKLAAMFDPLITYLPIDIQEELQHKIQEQKIAEGRNLDEEEVFQNQREPKGGVGDLRLPPETLQQVNQSEIDPPDSSRSAPQAEEEAEEDQLGNLDDTNTNIAAQSASLWRPSIRKQVKQISEKIQIPGLTKKKIEEDDDDENVDTSLTRKLARELTHEELTAIAFQHEAIRARPPILWIPEDELGIAKDEIYHTREECGREIQITCAGAVLNDKGKIIWSKNPPDYVYIPTL